MQPFYGFPIELSGGFPRAEVFDHFRPERSDNGFDQGVVVAVSDASDLHVDSGFREPFGISDGLVMHAAVRAVG